MQLLRRVGYFLVGVSISCIGVFYFWQKKNASFDYGMDARTLKTIRIRKKVYSDEAKKTMKDFDLDSLKISTILYTGDVDFGKSTPRQKPCAKYFISGKKELKSVSLIIERCDSTAIIKKILVNP